MASFFGSRALIDRVRAGLIRCRKEADSIGDRVARPAHFDDLQARKNCVQLLFFLTRSQTSVWAAKILSLGVRIRNPSHSLVVDGVRSEHLRIEGA